MSHTYKVFIIEDDRDISEMYSLKLEKEWFEVKIAEDWLTALTMIAGYLPDLILMDIMMPSMDWFETVSTIRKLAPTLENTKIIMFTNINWEENIQKAIEYWANDYLVKANTTPKQVVDKIKFHLWIELE